jgi:hypothetical protein
MKYYTCRCCYIIVPEGKKKDTHAGNCFTRNYRLESNEKFHLNFTSGDFEPANFEETEKGHYLYVKLRDEPFIEINDIKLLHSLFWKYSLKHCIESKNHYKNLENMHQYIKNLTHNLEQLNCLKDIITQLDNKVNGANNLDTIIEDIEKEYRQKAENNEKLYVWYQPLKD